MYKHSSRNLQRKHRVDKPLPTGGYIGSSAVDHDFIPSAANMSLEECKVEQRQLLLEKVRAENELIASKACGDHEAIVGLGRRLQGYAGRLGLLKKRIRDLHAISGEDVLRQAVREVVDAETWNAIVARIIEIQAEASAIEARRAATENTGAVHESAGPQDDAQNPLEPTP